MDTLIGKPITLDGQDIRDAKYSAELLKEELTSAVTPPMVKFVNKDATSIAIRVPEKAFYLLTEVLELLGQGDTVMCLPIHAEVSTQQAAELLQVSAPHIVKILKEGVLPYHKVGHHRRIRLSDLLEYKETHHKGTRPGTRKK